MTVIDSMYIQVYKYIPYKLCIYGIYNAAGLYIRYRHIPSARALVVALAPREDNTQTTKQSHLGPPLRSATFPPSPPQENQNAVIGFINIRAFFFEYYCGIYNVLKLILIDWLIQPKHLCQWSLSKPWSSSYLIFRALPPLAHAAGHAHKATNLCRKV